MLTFQFVRENLFKRMYSRQVIKLIKDIKDKFLLMSLILKILFQYTFRKRKVEMLFKAKMDFDYPCKTSLFMHN